MKRVFFVTLLAAVVAFGFSGTAAADSLQVTSGVGTDPTVIGTTGFTMLLNPSGSSLTDLILLFSVPVGTGAPTGLTSSLGSIGSPFLAGNLATSATCQDASKDVYSCAGFGQINDSNSLTNFNLANQNFNGFTATSYDIWETVVTGANMNGKDSIDIGGIFGVGTFVDGWAENTGSGPDPLFTAFTDAGLTTGVPEPASLALLGLGLLGAPLLRRKK